VFLIGEAGQRVTLVEEFEGHQVKERLGWVSKVFGVSPT
jgi:hypothetical protein